MTHSMNNKYGNILSGACGAIVMAIIGILVLLCFSNYKNTKVSFVKDPTLDAILDKPSWTQNDTIYLKRYLKNNFLSQAKTLETLKAEKVIVTPEQYSSDLSDYYNTLIAVLSALLVILNIIAFLSLKTNAETEYRARIQDLDERMNEKLAKVTENLLLDSEKVHNRIQALLIGWLDKDSNEKEDDLPNDITDRLDKIEKNMNALVDILAENEISRDREQTRASVVNRNNNK